MNSFLRRSLSVSPALIALLLLTNPWKGGNSKSPPPAEPIVPVPIGLPEPASKGADRKDPAPVRVVRDGGKNTSDLENQKPTLEHVLHRIAEETDPHHQEEILRDLLREVLTEGHAAALHRLEGLKVSPSVLDLKIRIVRDWTDLDPQAAALWAEQRPDAAERSSALEAVALVWSNRPDNAVIMWVDSLQNQEDRLPALAAVAVERVRSDPHQALELALQMDSNPRRNDLIRAALREWTVRDPEAAMDWALQIEDSNLYDKVVADVAMVWASRNPLLGATLASKALAPGRSQNRAAASIAQRWGQSSPDEALAWVKTFPEGEDRDYTFQVILEHWSKQDPAAARQWMLDADWPAAWNPSGE